MTDYRLWPSTNGSGTTSGGFTHDLGVQFKVNEDGVTFNGFYFWAPSGTFDTDHTKYSFRLYSTTNGTTGTLISGTTVNLETDLTQNAWNYQALTTPVSLTNGTSYVAVVHYSGSANSYVSSASYWSSGDGASGITQGPITAPGTSTALNGAQCAYNEPSASAAFPTSSLGSNYWIDVSVSSAGAGGGGSGNITHIATSEGTPTGSNTSTSTVTKPAGLAVDDVMVAYLVGNESGMSQPTGSTWTRILSQDSNQGNLFRVEVWYRVATSTDVAASNYVWRNGDSNSPFWATISAYRGVNTTNPIDAFDSVAAGSGSSQTTPAVTTTHSSMVLSHRATRRTTTSFNTFTSGVAHERFEGGNHGASTSYSAVMYDAGVETDPGTISGTSITANSTTSMTDSIATTVALRTLIVAVNANAGVATATAQISTPSLDLEVSPSPGAATATSSTKAPVVAIGALASGATAATSVKQVDVATTPFNNAPAGVATATVAAQQTRMDYAPAGRAQATATAWLLSESVGNRADTARATASAYGPAMGFAVPAGVAQANASGKTAAPGLAMSIGVASAFAMVHPVVSYFGSSRTINVSFDNRVIEVPWEERTLMVEES